MIAVKVDFTRLRFDVGALVPDKAQMRQVGEVALASIKSRVARGVGADDQQMPALTRSYGRFKKRRAGSSIRDLRLTGKMLDNLTVRSADKGEVTIALTSAAERVKGFRNQRISPWLGISPSDARAIMAKIAAIVVDNLKRRFLRAA
jgi:hypothetical protein